MNSKSIHLTLLLLLITTQLLVAQNIKIGIGGGYGHILEETYYSQSVNDDPFPRQLGLRNWYRINSVVKFIPERFPVIFTGEINYLAGRNDSDYSGYYSPLQSGPMDMHIKAAQDIFSAGIGIESPLFRGRKLTPYFSLGLILNYFCEPDVEWTPALDPMWYYYSPQDDKSVISSSFRGGLNIGIGVEYALNETLGLDITARYNFMNLIGQNDASAWEKEEDFNIFTVTARVLFCLSNCQNH